MSEFKRAMAVSALPEGTMKTVEVGGEHVLLVHSGGAYYGIGAICAHEEWDLSEGLLSGTTVMCAGHEAVWDLKTGRAKFDEPMADEPLYEVREEGGYLLVRKK